MATPFSVNAYGNFLAPIMMDLEVANCDWFACITLYFFFRHIPALLPVLDQTINNLNTQCVFYFANGFQRHILFPFSILDIYCRYSSPFRQAESRAELVQAMPRREKVHDNERFRSMRHICVLKAATGHPDRMSRCLCYIFSSGLTNRLRFEFLQSGQLFGETIQSIGLEVRKGKFTFQGRRGLHAVGSRSLIIRSFSEFYPRTHIHVS